ADLVALTNDYIGVAGFTNNQALIQESKDSPYANIIVVRAQDKNKPIFKKLIDAVHSKEAQAETNKLFPEGGAVMAW
ncbi:MetQ/NlpA family ABC transporter substrate-binding protein, partial [Acinetobacter baumannii]